MRTKEKQLKGEVTVCKEKTGCYPGKGFRFKYKNQRSQASRFPNQIPAMRTNCQTTKNTNMILVPWSQTSRNSSLF
jgi:hypothetical protein